MLSSFKELDRRLLLVVAILLISLLILSAIANMGDSVEVIKICFYAVVLYICVDNIMSNVREILKKNSDNPQLT